MGPSSRPRTLRPMRRPSDARVELAQAVTADSESGG